MVGVVAFLNVGIAPRGRNEDDLETTPPDDGLVVVTDFTGTPLAAVGNAEPTENIFPDWAPPLGAYAMPEISTPGINFRPVRRAEELDLHTPMQNPERKYPRDR